MIRVSLNLARRPAENLRRVWIVWGGGLALLIVLLLSLSTVALVEWMRSRQVQAQVNAVHDRIAPLESRTQADQAPLAQPRIRVALDQAAFLNQLLDRKAVSWTRLFERLEAIMPPQVELVSLRPLDRNGQSAIDLRFASDDLDPAIAFVNALETSSDFSDAKVERETGNTAPAAVETSGRGAAQEKAPKYLIEATALYRPGPDAAANAAPDAADSSGDPGAEPAAPKPAPAKPAAKKVHP